MTVFLLNQAWTFYISSLFDYYFKVVTMLYLTLYFWWLGSDEKVSSFNVEGTHIFFLSEQILDQKA